MGAPRGGSAENRDGECGACAGGVRGGSACGERVSGNGALKRAGGCCVGAIVSAWRPQYCCCGTCAMVERDAVCGRAVNVGMGVGARRGADGSHMSRWDGLPALETGVDVNSSAGVD